MDENLFRDPLLSPHTMTACDDCLACERASVLVKIRRPAPVPPAGTGRRTQSGPGSQAGHRAGPRQLSPASCQGSQCHSCRPGSCQAPHTLTLGRDVTLSLLSCCRAARHVTRAGLTAWLHWPPVSTVCITALEPVATACEERRGATRQTAGTEINKDYNWTLQAGLHITHRFHQTIPEQFLNL